MNELTIHELFDLEHTMAKEYIEKYTYPWEILPVIGSTILSIREKLNPGE